MKNSSKVFFISQKLEEKFSKLSFGNRIKKAIIKSIFQLRRDAFSGIQIPKRMFPKGYVKKWGINNLWKHNLPQGYRLIYTVTGDDNQNILVAILDWFDHKKYEKKFRY